MKSAKVQQMFDSIAPRYDLVNRIMTFGMDIGWRKKAVRSLELSEGDLVLDVACGTGDLCRELMKTGARAVGVDYSFGMLASARTESALIQADGLKLPFRSAAAKGVTCGFALRNVTSIDALFEEFARVSAPEARLAILEVAEPSSKVVRAGHHVYFHKVVPWVGGLLSDKDAYRYLPESTAYLPETPDLLEMLRRAGFHRVRAEMLGLGAAQLITARRR
jgi:demethylmenaquinone methyltransferase/2-methoxy-6-polyprenyl-1,4-benzoquinol methylase